MIKGTKNSILNIVEYIKNGTNLKIKLVYLSLKNKGIAYCFELTFGMIFFSSYVYIETMNVISSDVEMNKRLANNPINLFYCCLKNYLKRFVKIHENNITLL